MPFYQGSNTDGHLIAGGLALSESQDTLFYSVSSSRNGSDGSNGNTNCRIESLPVDSILTGTTTPTLVYSKDDTMCPLLERHYNALLWLGVEESEFLATKSTTGQLGIYDFTQQQQQRSNTTLLGPEEYPVSIASQLSEQALWVTSWRRSGNSPRAATQENDGDDGDDGSGDDGGTRSFETDVEIETEILPWSSTAYAPSSPENDSPNTSLLLTRLGSVQKNFQIEWTKEHATVKANKPKTVLPAAMVAMDDYLVIAGSTNGKGAIFGSGNGGDMDGFLAKLDSQTGELLAATGSTTTLRMGTKADDWIINACVVVDRAVGDEQDESTSGNTSVYVVGASKGSMAKSNDNQKSNHRSFVAKIDTTSMTKKWLKEFPAEYQNYATHCHVHSESRSIYVGGTVVDGPLQSSSSDTNKKMFYGDADVFVAKITESSGDLEWVEQMGSAGRDQLAGMEYLAASQELLLFGITNGSWFHANPNQVDQVVVWTVDAVQGSSFTTTTTTDEPTEDPEDTVTDEPTEDLENTEPPTPAPTPAPIPAPIPSPTKATSTEGVLPDSMVDEPPPEDDWDDVSDTDQGAFHLMDELVAHGTGYQSNMGPTYAGAMVYDFTRHAVYLTGSSYGHSGHHHVDAADTPNTAHCFLTHLRMVGLDWNRQVPAKDEDQVQACNALARHEDHLYMAGFVINDPKKGMYSILNQLDRSQYNPDWNFLSEGWLQDDTTPIGYPTAMVVDSSISTSTSTSGNDRSMFVVSLESTDTSSNVDYAIESDPDFPNLTTGGHIKYGSHYRVAIQHYHASNDPSQDRLVQDWKTIIEPTDDTLYMGGVYGTGVYQVDSTLYVVGSVKGSMTVQSADDSTTASEATTTTDPDEMDGFIATLNTATGRADKIRRLNSSDDRKNWVTSICGSPQHGLFIVGATTGDLTASSSQATPALTDNVNAFVAKIDPTTLDSVWTRQFLVQPAKKQALGAASAYGCSLVHQKNLLYVAGVVKDGASIQQQQQQEEGGDKAHKTKSAGSDDVFAAQLHASSGEIQWIRQIGSSRHENLARNGGIVTDMEGDAILYGDTAGNLFRKRARSSTNTPPTSDVFVVTLKQSDGSFSPTAEVIQRDLVVGLAIGLLLPCVCCLGCVYRLWLRRQNNNSMSANRFFPDDETNGFQDEMQELVVSKGNGSRKASTKGGGGHVELASRNHRPEIIPSTETAQQRRLHDFMPQYYSHNRAAAVRPGRNVV